ncbi:hypothetical protein H206_01621 [Candidatus Electrothrix aarhusensis]|uniref:Uncharacterized protein n=1 Tax=Candidatus Electrothrix aarhusensis TaxID=1859131 RepID=A0A3S3QQG8_9BACT|nr:hypothetical protein H206_01621 [Candidatus Electrothrix aarhusensis]
MRVNKIQTFFLTGPVLLLSIAISTTHVFAEESDVKPIKEFRSYLSANRPTKSIKFSSLQDIKTRKKELKFKSTSKMVLNLLPYLDSPSSVAKITENLKAQGIQPEVSTVEVFDFSDRVIVKQELKYKGNARACRERGDELSKLGISCYKKKSGANRPSADMQKKIQDMRRELNGLRKSPVVGYSIAELKAMNDEELLGAALNGGDFTDESYVMIPKVKWNDIKSLPMAKSENDFTLSQLDLRTTADRVRLDRFRRNPVPEIFELPPGGFHIPEMNIKKHAQETHYLVNGFTWSTQYNWSKKYGGCTGWGWAKVCAYVNPHAEIGYGLGVRIPLQLDLSVERTIGAHSHELKKFYPKINLFPVDGNEKMYLAAKMPQDKLFKGKELVAEASATVGLRYKLPFSKELNPRKNWGIDLTEYLSSKGNIKPPSPGNSLTLGKIESPDFSGGYFNYGVVGATFHALAKLNMNCKSLTITSRFPPFVGENNGIHTNNKFPAGASPLVFQDHSSYDAYNPVYKASLTVVPGLRVHTFMDVSVYELSKNFDVWINKISIESPDFQLGTHAGTIRGYSIQATGDQLKITPVN